MAAWAARPERGPHPRRRDDGDPGAQRGVLRPGRADVERVRHASGRASTGSRTRAAPPPARPPAARRTEGRAGHRAPRQSSCPAVCHLALTDRWPPAGEPTQAQRAWQHALSILEEIQHLNAGPRLCYATASVRLVSACRARNRGAGMRVGVTLLPEHAWEQDRHRWKRAEQYGFDHAWTFDHLAWRSLADSAWYATIPTLVAAALESRRCASGRGSRPRTSAIPSRSPRS